MSDMTQSFIEMVEAYKAKPGLEAEIKRLSDDNAMCYGIIDQLRFEIVTLEASYRDWSRRVGRSIGRLLTP